jgi:hypothetical protein
VLSLVIMWKYADMGTSRQAKRARRRRQGSSTGHRHDARREKRRSPPDPAPGSRRWMHAVELGARKLSLVWWVAATIVLVALTVLRTTGWSPTAVPISGAFHSAGTIRAVFSRPLLETTSPGCGCVDNRPPGGWQGLTLPASAMQIGLEGMGRATDYTLFSPNPGPWSDLPKNIGLAFESAEFITPEAEPPAAVFMSQVGWRHLKSLASLHTVADWLDLESHGVLHAASRGPEPLAAIGPPAGVPVDIGYQSEQANPKVSAVSMHVPFGDSAAKPEGTAIPLVDVIGSELFFWTRLRSPNEGRLGLGYDTVPPEPFRPHGVDRNESFHEETVELTFGSPPSVPPRWATWLAIRVVPRSTFSVRVESLPENASDQLNYAPEHTKLPRGSAVLSILSHNASSSSTSLEKSAEATERDPLVWLHRIDLIKASGETPQRRVENEPKIPALYDLNGSMEFAYPPPPVAGVNVFGPISSLEMSAAEGAMVVGDAPEESLSAGTPVELTHIRGVGITGHRMTIPVRFEGHEAAIHVQGSAIVKENGISKRLAQAWWRSLLPTQDLIGTLLAVASLAVGIASWRMARSERT